MRWKGHLVALEAFGRQTACSEEKMRPFLGCLPKSNFLQELQDGGAAVAGAAASAAAV